MVLPSLAQIVFKTRFYKLYFCCELYHNRFAVGQIDHVIKYLCFHQNWMDIDKWQIQVYKKFGRQVVYNLGRIFPHINIVNQTLLSKTSLIACKLAR